MCLVGQNIFSRKKVFAWKMTSLIEVGKTSYIIISDPYLLPWTIYLNSPTRSSLQCFAR